MPYLNAFRLLFRVSVYLPQPGAYKIYLVLLIKQRLRIYRYKELN